jgi:hypothetical protein
MFINKSRGSRAHKGIVGKISDFDKSEEFFIYLGNGTVIPQGVVSL